MRYNYVYLFVAMCSLIGRLHLSSTVAETSSCFPPHGTSVTVEIMKCHHGTF